MAILFALPIFLQAQLKAVHITDSGELYSTFNLEGDEDAKAELRKVVSAYELTNIIKYSVEDNWPSGIATLSARDENRPKIALYHTYLLGTFDSKGVLVIPADENKHMPSNMLPSRDIYFIMGNSGYANGATGGTSSSSAASDDDVHITDSGELYSTPNLEDDETAKEALKSVVSAYELNNIIKYSTEDNWPSGIATLDARNENRPKIADYHVHLVVEYGETGILRIPADENTHMPSNMRPTRDIYFAIGKSGYSGGGSGDNVTLAESPAEEETRARVYITDPMQLMSTIKLREDANFNREMSANYDSETLDYIAKYAYETTWPSGISTFSARENTRPKFKDYVAYYVGEYTQSNGNAVVLMSITKEDNTHMANNMQPATDEPIVFAFLKKGVRIDGNTNIASTMPVESRVENNTSSSTSSISHSYSIAEATDFPKQLNVLIDGLQDNFSFLKRGEIKEENTSLQLTKRHKCAIQMLGAEQTYISQGLMGDVSAIADYGTFETKEQAQEAFALVEAAVRKTKFSCCTMVALDAISYESLTSQAWIPFGGTGAWEKLLVEIQLMKIPSFDTKKSATYSVTLRVGHQPN